MTHNAARRRFLRKSAIVAATAGLYPAIPAFSAVTALPLKAAGYRFPRTEALFSGSLSIEGCDTSFQEAGIGDINSNVFSGPQTYDFCEIGLHPFMMAYANDKFRDYTLLPIFPLRTFRHKSIFIRADRKINSPEDLKGKSIATPGYSSTSLTWIRGLLQDEYGVHPEDVEWVVARKDSSAALSGKVSSQESVIPKGLSVKQGPVGVDESELLVSGEVDALFHAVAPQAFVEGNPIVTRLFSNSKLTEQAYYRKTGIFPIMHAVAVRKSLLEANPWLAKSLFNGYSKAKFIAYQRMTKLGWAEDMLPWYEQGLKEVQNMMSRNWYSYGIKGNELALNTLFRYSHEQRLSSKQLSIQELFHPLGMSLQE